MILAQGPATNKPNTHADADQACRFSDLTFKSVTTNKPYHDHARLYGKSFLPPLRRMLREGGHQP